MNGLAMNTRNTYKAGLKQYHEFCGQLNLATLPLDETVIEDFCIRLSKKVSLGTIRVYLCGIQFYSKIHGGRELIANMIRLPILLRGIRRGQGNKHTRPRRAPITIEQVRTIRRFIRKIATPHNQKMLYAMVSLAFFGLLRVSEYTSPSTTSFDPALHLSSNDVTINGYRRMAYIRIKQSKTDPFRIGTTIRVGTTHDELCPVSNLINHLKIHGNRPGPLFVFQNGHHLTRGHVVEILKRSLKGEGQINTHSFRIGGASNLASGNTPDYVIQIMGRWRSDAYKRYLNLSDEFVSDISKRMATQTLSARTWNADLSRSEAVTEQMASELRVSGV